MLKKFGIYILMCIPAAVLAGIYGIIHNQISYTISSEYFTHFKFIQFNVPWAYSYPRLGAAYVGFLATWWMGILVFIPLGWFGFIFPNTQQMAIQLMRAFLVVAATALSTGLLGLAYAYFQVNSTSIHHYVHWLRDGISHPIPFIRVGFMHNCSYFGGVTGLLAGIVYLLIAKVRCSKNMPLS